MKLSKFYFLGLFLMFFFNVLFAQSIDTLETERMCNQYNLIIHYLKNDNISKKYFNVKNVKLQISPYFYYSGYFPIMTYELIGIEKGISTEQVLKMDKDSLELLYNKYEKAELLDTNCYNSLCLKKIQSVKMANVSLEFSRYNEDLVIAATRKNFRKKRHSLGEIILFKFDADNNFICVRKSYIE